MNPADEALVSDMEVAVASACGASCPLEPTAPPCRECSYFRLFSDGVFWERKRVVKFLQSLERSPSKTFGAADFYEIAKALVERDE